MIKTIGVVGAGTMGSGIAQVFAQADYSVQLVDVARPMLDTSSRADSACHFSGSLIRASTKNVRSAGNAPTR